MSDEDINFQTYICPKCHDDHHSDRPCKDTGLDGLIHDLMIEADAAEELDTSNSCIEVMRRAVVALSASKLAREGITQDDIDILHEAAERLVDEGFMEWGGTISKAACALQPSANKE